MKLVLAEKPSVAQSIAKVLGAAKREDGYLEGNGYVVSWCVGHLVELAQPEVYDAKYSKWAYADLPIFPMDWQYEVSAGTKKQFGILKKLMAREDVASLVCATDAGREGELIFRLVYHKAGCRKPFERLWISSMEDVAIKEGFENLRSGTEYDALYEAALCRERADWIVGINATRLFSTLYGQTLNVGRVMTPTLAMAVMREAAISAFKPELFYTVQIGLDGFTAASERFKTKAAAEAVKQSCSVAIVQKAECKEKTEKPPALYDLTSLQREANRVLGYTAQQTLDYTQNLYEKKLVTYPRTDSRFLTEDMAHSLTDLVKLAFHTFPVEDVDNIPVHAEQVVNNKKVTDHHAIIPTRELQKCNLSELPKGELAILQLISNRLCVAVGDPHRYAETVIELDCGGTVFSTKGKTVVQDGWKALVQKNDSTKSDENVQTLPSVSVGDEMTVSGTEIKEGKTSPPKHFTEDTLLSAMETAGADEMPDEVERKGLGTPATRAGIIEKLVRIGFLERKGDKKTKHLIPTHKGTALVTVMPEQIQSPSMTADWEEKLLLIEKGEYASEDFMDEIKDVIAGLIQNYEVIRDSEVMMSKEANSIGKCPLCGSAVEDKAKAFFCSNRACKFALWKNNRYFASIGKSMTSATAQKLLGSGNRNKEVQVYQYVTEGTFDAYLYQTLENKQKFISQIMTSKSPVRSCDDVDEQALSYAEIKALCAGNPLIKEKMDLDIDVARLKVLKADHQSQQYRMEDKLLKYFPAEIEKQTGYIHGFEADIKTVEAHPQIADGFCGMEIMGKAYTEKADAGEILLAACKDTKSADPVPLGSYRGFQMELSFDSFRNEFDVTLKGAVSHRVALGTDARGNITRLDNALAGILERLERANEQLNNLYNQQEAAKAEVGKPFPQEAELTAKSQRLAELDAALNMEDSVENRDERSESERPSVLADLKSKAEHIPPAKYSETREEVL